MTTVRLTIELPAAVGDVVDIRNHASNIIGIGTSNAELGVKHIEQVAVPAVGDIITVGAFPAIVTTVRWDTDLCGADVRAVTTRDHGNARAFREACELNRFAVASSANAG